MIARLGSHLLLEVPDRERRLAGLSEVDVLSRLEVFRYFTDGVALGSSAFVNRFFERKRAYFGPRRESGARKMRGAEWGNLRCLRDLRVPSIG